MHSLLSVAFRLHAQTTTALQPGEWPRRNCRVALQLTMQHPDYNRTTQQHDGHSKLVDRREWDRLAASTTPRHPAPRATCSRSATPGRCAFQCTCCSPRLGIGPGTVNFVTQKVSKTLLAYALTLCLRLLITGADTEMRTRLSSRYTDGSIDGGVEKVRRRVCRGR